MCIIQHKDRLIVQHWYQYSLNRRFQLITKSFWLLLYTGKCLPRQNDNLCISYLFQCGVIDSVIIDSQRRSLSVNVVQTFEELVCLAIWEGQGHRDLWPDLINEVSLWYEWLNCRQDSASITDFCLLENSRVIKMTYFSKEIILRVDIFGSFISWKTKNF